MPKLHIYDLMDSAAIRTLNTIRVGLIHVTVKFACAAVEISYGSDGVFTCAHPPSRSAKANRDEADGRLRRPRLAAAVLAPVQPSRRLRGHGAAPIVSGHTPTMIAA